MRRKGATPRGQGIGTPLNKFEIQGGKERTANVNGAILKQEEENILLRKRGKHPHLPREGAPTGRVQKRSCQAGIFCAQTQMVHQGEKLSQKTTTNDYLVHRLWGGEA